jgi:hypothetical protein
MDESAGRWRAKRSRSTVDGRAWCAVDGGVQARTVDGLTVDGLTVAYRLRHAIGLRTCDQRAWMKLRPVTKGFIGSEKAGKPSWL